MAFKKDMTTITVEKSLRDEIASMGSSSESIGDVLKKFIINEKEKSRMRCFKDVGKDIDKLCIILSESSEQDPNREPLIKLPLLDFLEEIAKRSKASQQEA